jgi:hypothetical protein
VKALRENLETAFTGNNDPNGSNKPKKKKRKSKQIWTDELEEEEFESSGLAYPNLVAPGSYDGGMKISTDGNDSGEVLPAAKRLERRRRRGSTLASTGSNLSAGEKKRRGEMRSAGGVDRYL